MAKFNLHVKASYCSYNVALLYVLGMDHWKKKLYRTGQRKVSKPHGFYRQAIVTTVTSSRNKTGTGQLSV